MKISTMLSLNLFIVALVTLNTNAAPVVDQQQQQQLGLQQQQQQESLLMAAYEFCCGCSRGRGKNCEQEQPLPEQVENSAQQFEWGTALRPTTQPLPRQRKPFAWPSALRPITESSTTTEEQKPNPRKPPLNPFPWQAALRPIDESSPMTEVYVKSPSKSYITKPQIAPPQTQNPEIFNIATPRESDQQHVPEHFSLATPRAGQVTREISHITFDGSDSESEESDSVL
eukprot:Pgem_evm1s9820